MRMGLVLGAVGLAIVVAGCTPTYVAPRSGPVAQVSLTRGTMNESEHAKLMVTRPDGSGRADITGGLLFTYDKPAAVPAGTPLHMELQTLRYAGQTEIYCGYRFMFVPQPERVYAVSPDTGGSRACRANLVDTQTGQTPPSFQMIPIGPGWRPAD